MAKTTAPLFGFEAAGQLGKSLVFAEWKGRSYARRYVIPSNPQSAAQTLTRNAFGWLTNAWKYAPSPMVDAFAAYASGRVMTAQNAFIQQNLPVLRPQTDLAGMVFSPGARSGIAAAAMVLTPGADQLTVDLTAPTLPTGWTIAAAWAATIEDVDPQSSTVYTFASGTDAATPFSIVLTGLTTAGPYRVGGWFTYTRPDGLVAYGPSIDDVATPS